MEKQALRPGDRFSLVNTGSLMNLFRHISLHSTEKQVAEYLIIPLLKRWGYTESDWQREVELGRKRADLIIGLIGENLCKMPYLVIEIKAPRCHLGQRTGQLQRYLRASQALFGLLTNGLEFYLFSEVLNVREKVEKRARNDILALKKSKKFEFMLKQLRQLIKPLLKLLPQNDYPVLDSQLFVLIWIHFVLNARISTMRAYSFS